MRMVKESVLTAEHWTSFNRLMKQWFGYEASKQQYVDFVNYCEAGVVENGVKPILNPINLYAYEKGLASQDVIALLFKQEEAHG